VAPAAQECAFESGCARSEIALAFVPRTVISRRQIDDDGRIRHHGLLAVGRRDLYRLLLCRPSEKSGVARRAIAPKVIYRVGLA
jgi:hypothetical protein